MSKGTGSSVTMLDPGCRDQLHNNNPSPPAALTVCLIPWARSKRIKTGMSHARCTSAVLVQPNVKVQVGQLSARRQPGDRFHL
jgi:hypothetical protein